MYNDGDYSDYLYTKPAFASGFLPLEPLEEPTAKPSNPMAIHKSKIRPAETCNTGTTPPPTTSVKKDVVPKSTMMSESQAAVESPAATRAAERRERRPSFIQVTPVDVHHEHQHEHAKQEKRRHSSASHLPMSWWPEDEGREQHQWVENGETLLADEEEEVLEEEIWEDAFYE